MPKASNSHSAPPTVLPAQYEQAVQELETLVQRMESGDLLLASYERGAALLQLCRDKLQAVENQIKVLDNGVLKPWKNG